MKTKEIRKQLGLTQSELAEILGLSSQVRIAEYENGTRKPSNSIKIILLLLKNKPQLVKLVRAISKSLK